MCDKSISLETMTAANPNNNEIYVIKLNAEQYDLDEIPEIFTTIKNQLPHDSNVVLLPYNVQLEVDDINNVIMYLESVKQY